MIEIEKSNRTLTEVEQYMLTLNPAIKVIKNIEDGTQITVDAWATFTDKKDDGEEVHLLSILDVDGTVYSCQSETFKNSFFDIARICDKKTFTIVKLGGTTKKGREYVNCGLVAVR